MAHTTVNIVFSLSVVYHGYAQYRCLNTSKAKILNSTIVTAGQGFSGLADHPALQRFKYTRPVETKNEPILVAGPEVLIQFLDRVSAHEGLRHDYRQHG